MNPFVTLTGRLTRDANCEFSPTGKAIVRFSVATSAWDSKTKSRKSCFWNCDLWGERGEKIVGYLKKGIQIVVAGSISYNDYKEKRYYNINVSELEFCQSPKKAVEASGKMSESEAMMKENDTTLQDDGDDSEVPF